MKKEKIVLLFLLSLSCNVFASEDYSKNNNPFKHYKYETEWQRQVSNTQSQNIRQNSTSQEYFTNNIQNPIALSKSGKYKHLINNAHKIHGCWDRAGAAYNVDPWLLFAIAKVESSFNNKATNQNKDKNKSIDVGLMQINSWWLPRLSKYGITRDHLFEPCTSIFVGAWIVAQNIQRFGYNQDGIGAYNSPNNITIRRAYAQKVYKAYNELTNDFGVNIRKVSQK